MSPHFLARPELTGSFVLHVVEPHLNGPGGDLASVIDPRVLGGQGPASRGASIAHFREQGFGVVSGAVDAWPLPPRGQGATR